MEAQRKVMDLALTCNTPSHGHLYFFRTVLLFNYTSVEHELVHLTVIRLKHVALQTNAFPNIASFEHV